MHSKATIERITVWEAEPVLTLGPCQVIAMAERELSAKKARNKRHIERFR